MPIPIVGGRNRIASNLIWYGDFIAKAVSGGKKGGGGGGSTKKGGGEYDYGAAVILALCQGPIIRIGNVWANSGYLAVNLTQESYTVGGGDTYLVTQTNTFLQDMGCQRQDPYSIASNDFGSPYGSIVLSGNQLTPMVAVGGAPSAGQYNVSGIGLYTFSAADAGKNITINYTYAPPITAGGVSQDPIVTLGLSTFTGAQSQAAWSYMTSNHPTQALGYSTVAYVASPRIDLGTSGTIPNLNFEVYGIDSFGNGVFDCDPSVWCVDFLTNPLWGCNFVAGDIGSTAAYSNYCVANGLFISPVCDQARTAADYLNDWLAGTNTELVESGGKLNFIPRGDTTVVGNGQTFTPSTAPIYNLDDDDFIREGMTPGVTIERPTVQDAYNSIKIEYVDVFNNYNPNVVEAQDLGAIQRYKYRPEGQRSYHFFTQQAPAALAAQTLLSRIVYIRNKYKFKLPARYFLLDPMDIVTIPNSLLYGSSDQSLVPVRLTSVVENDDRTLTMEAEDFPWGCSGPTLYPKQTPSPSGPNAYAPPGAINPPIMFEALSRLNSQIGHYIWFGLSGASQFWGGCNISVSLDGSEYKKVGTATSPCIMGLTTADFPFGSDPDTTDTLSVDLTESFGVLQSGTQLDADSGALMCFVGSRIASTSIPQTWILLDGSSQKWAVTITAGGLLQTNAVGSGTVTTMDISDIGGTTSWQIGVTTGGLITTTSITYSSAYPTVLAFTGSPYVLEVNSGGILQTLSGQSQTGGELVSYETATLTGSYKYNVGANPSPVVAGYLRRGVYNSVIADHPLGSAFMLLNDSVEGWNYDVGLIGTTVYFKFTSFNQSGLVEQNIANVAAYQYTITGNSIGLLTPAHASYAPTSNPLTGHDAGSSATIFIASFFMRVPGMADIPFNSGAVIGLSYNTLYYVYFDDPGFIPGAVTYFATTTKSVALNAAGRFFVGSCMMPRAGAPDTIGNNDGGAAAQLGQITVLSMSVSTPTTTGGGGTITGAALAVDGDLTTFAVLKVTGSTVPTGGSAILTLAGPPGVTQRFESVALKLVVGVPTNSYAAPASFAIGNLSLDGGSTYSSTIFQLNAPSTEGRTIYSTALPVGQNLSQVVVQLAASVASNASGTVELDVYGAYLEGTA